MPGMKGKVPVILGLILIGNSVRGWSYAEYPTWRLSGSPHASGPQWFCVVKDSSAWQILGAHVAKAGSCDDKERIWVW